MWTLFGGKSDTLSASSAQVLSEMKGRAEPKA